ncbi:MAG: ABC transporter ATP-binding protein [Hyphomicrobiales bacterium]|nr:ABC transporter ATP-binding protein [Hyphomicrobiales bacterium]
MSDLVISQAHKRYGDVHAVRGVDLNIPEGEFCVLVGPSGCGKSTLLRMIAGLETIGAGDISIGGARVNDFRPRDRNIAMVFQNYALYPYLTVFENIAFPLRARKVETSEIPDRVASAASLLGIEALLERYPRQLSGGQRQRAAIGRAIVRNAGLFLLDEPLSNLDAQLRDEMRVELKRLHQGLGKTFIYVTHDQIEAMTLADRIVLLRDGQIEQQGSPLEVFERPRTRFVAGFLGSPKMNFLSARLAGSEGIASVRFSDGTELQFPPDRSAQFNETGLEERPIIFGVRPEHIAPQRHEERRREGQYPLKAKVDLVQPTGTRTYIQFRLGDERVTAELQAHDVEQPGAHVDLLVDMNRTILIDPQTERVL